MIRVLEKLWAFLKRDFLSEVSYRLAFLLQVFGIVLSMAAFYFMTGMIDPATPGLDGIPPFQWLLVGLAFQYNFSTRSRPRSETSRCSGRSRRCWCRRRRPHS